MPAEADVTLNIDFTWGGAARFDPNTATRAITTAVNNVGVRVARNRQRKLQANVQRDFAPVVERELLDMARSVARMGIGLANFNNPPPGVLSITGRISRPMIGNSAPMSISSMTGAWAVRTDTYMRWKMRKHRTRKWFYNTGSLQRQMGKVGVYRSAYGPMSIKFTPTSLTGAARVAGIGRSSGGQSNNIMIGRLEVSPLRRLRLSDLPGIGQQAGYNERLMNPLAAGIRRKLVGRKDKYRPVIEPFLTYYMTRRIPNAVYRRLEDSLA